MDGDEDSCLAPVDQKLYKRSDYKILSLKKISPTCWIQSYITSKFEQWTICFLGKN